MMAGTLSLWWRKPVELASRRDTVTVRRFDGWRVLDRYFHGCLSAKWIISECRNSPRTDTYWQSLLQANYSVRRLKRNFPYPPRKSASNLQTKAIIISLIGNLSLIVKKLAT
jgi:hypothetical protein